MSNKDQTAAPPGEGNQPSHPVEEPEKHPQGPEIQPVPPEHDKKPETAHDEAVTPKNVKPS